MMRFSSVIISLKHEYVVVFDLDDTLYQEEDFLRSGFAEIAAYLEKITGENFLAQMLAWRESREVDVFSELLQREKIAKQVSKEQLLELYRFHTPHITLSSDAAALLEALRAAEVPLALITDGRSVTQRNKLKALGVDSFFELLVVSEEVGSMKPAEDNYLLIEKRWPEKKYVYVADNTAKDFITPNKRGWRTVCLLDRGRNIHPQSFDLAPEYLPELRVHSLQELITYLS